MQRNKEPEVHAAQLPGALCYSLLRYSCKIYQNSITTEANKARAAATCCPIL